MTFSTLPGRCPALPKAPLSKSHVEGVLLAAEQNGGTADFSSSSSSTCVLGDEGVLQLATLVCDGRPCVVNRLILDHQSITSCGVILLCTALLNSPLRTTLLALSLSHNPLHDHGICTLSQLLADTTHFTSLRELSAEHVHMTDAGARFLLAALARNRSLVRIRVAGNELSLPMKRALTLVLQPPLSDAGDVNQVARLMPMVSSPPPPSQPTFELAVGVDEGLAQATAKKLYLDEPPDTGELSPRDMNASARQRRIYFHKQPSPSATPAPPPLEKETKVKRMIKKAIPKTADSGQEAVMAIPFLQRNYADLLTHVRQRRAKEQPRAPPKAPRLLDVPASTTEALFATRFVTAAVAKAQATAASLEAKLALQSSPRKLTRYSRVGRPLSGVEARKLLGRLTKKKARPEEKLCRKYEQAIAAKGVVACK